MSISKISIIGTVTSPSSLTLGKSPQYTKNDQSKSDDYWNHQLDSIKWRQHKKCEFLWVLTTCIRENVFLIINYYPQSEFLIFHEDARFISWPTSVLGQSSQSDDTGVAWDFSDWANLWCWWNVRRAVERACWENTRCEIK